MSLALSVGTQMVSINTLSAFDQINGQFVTFAYKLLKQMLFGSLQHFEQVTSSLFDFFMSQNAHGVFFNNKII